MIIELKDLSAGQQALADALLTMDRVRVKSLIEAELEGGDELVTLTDQTLVPVLEAIGNGWEAGEPALSQMYMAGRIVEERLPQKFTISPPEASSARIAITVLEDYHMLGKNMVVSLLRAAGHSVQDWGRTSVEEAVERARTEETELLLISRANGARCFAGSAIVGRLGRRRAFHPHLCGGSLFPLRYRLVRRGGGGWFRHQCR